MLSVASSCHYNENSKNGKNRFRQIPTPWGGIPTNPHPQAKARMQKPHGGGKFYVQIPWGEQVGMVMDEIDTCISVYLTHCTPLANGTMIFKSLCFSFSRLMALKRMGIVDNYEVSCEDIAYYLSFIVKLSCSTLTKLPQLPVQIQFYCE